MRKLVLFAFLGFFLVFSLGAAPAAAQTANTGIVLGTVTDPGGAVVPDAKVELTNTATNETHGTTTSSAGQFTFPGVAPGPYKVTVTKAGFATFVVSNLNVDVNKGYTVDVKLQIRSGTEVVEVSAEARAELQTTDAVVGDVVGGTTLGRLPTLNRSAGELLTLQPGSTPYDSNQTGFGNSGGTVAGARSDQNAFNLDGIDVTDNVIAGGGMQAPIIPIGVESVDEFRVGVTNANATFGRSSGGQVALVSKSGTNNFHGNAYWFHQNDDLNASSWDNNRNKIPKAEQRDNRGGFNFGGPLRKDKTFFFGNYEVRRFFQSFNIARIVPTQSLSNGNLTFTDCSSGQFDSKGNCTGTGTTVIYPLATAANCGADSTGQPLNQVCDPRGIGISPTIQQLWKLMPGGNDSTQGDVLNTVGFRATVPAPLKDDFVSLKLDHNFTDKLHFFGRYMYSRDLSPNGGQADLRGGVAKNPSNSNIRGDGFISGLEWQLRSNLTNSFRAGWIRSRQDFTVIRPRDSAPELNLPGTDSALGTVALAPGLVQTGFLDTLVDVDTQRARHQAIYDSNKQYADNLTWVKGTHAIVSGVDVRWLPTIHDRDDKVIGSLNSLVAAMDADLQFLSIPQADRPPTCAPAVPASGGNPAIPAVTTNCIRSSDTQTWDRLYAASLGLVDNVGILIVRDGNLQPKPLGASLISKDTLRAYDFFTQDTWRIKPSFTLTYGIAYGWQTTPQEQSGQQTFIVNHDANDEIINAFDYLDQKFQYAASGNIFNPTLAYLPVKKSGRHDVFNVDYSNIAPRLSAAWNPSFKEGALHHFLGDRKTVIRGGYGISYDRVNTVQSVIIPMLGVGFAQTINVVTPACNATQLPVQGCNPSGADPGSSIFRVGVDGNIPVPPAPTAATSPVVPGLGFSELLSFQNDPDFQVGRSHMIDFTIQRELPANLLMEVGYVGRLGRNLPNSVNFNSAPTNFLDKTSGQTFAQAFDTVATALRTGQAVQDQPWFENQLPNLQTFSGVPFFGGPPLFVCSSATSATTCMAEIASSGFRNGQISSMFITMDLARLGYMGLPTYNNLQVFDLFTRTSRDYSNYHALVVTLRNRGWRGLQFDANYTFSKSLDTVGAVQNSASYYASSFNRSLEYGPSFFNRTHVFNVIYNYDLPFGKGRLGNRHAFVRKIIGGWYTCGIIRYAGGLPEVVFKTNQAFGGGSIFGFNDGLIPLVDPGSLATGRHNGVNGSGGIGTAGNPANGGSGINIFADPQKVSNEFRDILLAKDGRDGRSRPFYGFPFANWDARIGKVTGVTERFKVEYSADFFNALNNVNFLDPSFDLTNPKTFGVVTTQYIPANRNSGSRWIQFGLRVSF